MENAPSHCILCGSTERRPLVIREPWHVHRCASCGLGFLDPRPSKDRIARLYSQEYCESHFAEGGRSGSREFKKRLGQETHRVRFFRGMKRRGRVLDMGCGYGYFLAACREYGYDVRGLDTSEWATRHAVEALHLPVTLGELDSVKLEPDGFDVVTMWHFLEHTPDPITALGKAREWLKPDGVLVVDVPNREGTDALAEGDDWVGWSLPYHFYHFTPDTLRRMLTKCGFRVVKSKDYHSDAVKMKLKRIPVVGLFARLISKMYSGHSIAMIARIDDARQVGGDPSSDSEPE